MRVLPEPCVTPRMPGDLVIRLLPKALPRVSPNALAIAGPSSDYASAFVFCDRILALRTHTRLLPIMIGRVMAHELIHLLLPQEHHAQTGLMRGQWIVDDLQMTSAACRDLPWEAQRRLHRP